MRHSVVIWFFCKNGSRSGDHPNSLHEFTWIETFARKPIIKFWGSS